MVLNGDIDNKTANTLLYACNSALGAVRTDVYKEKVEELEVLVAEMKEREKQWKGK